MNEGMTTITNMNRDETSGWKWRIISSFKRKLLEQIGFKKYLTLIYYLRVYIMRIRIFKYLIIYIE